MNESKKALDGNEGFIQSINVGGKEIEDEKVYSISTSNYVAGQFKKYFGDVSEEIIVTDTNILDRDLIIEAVENQKNINSVLEKRIIDISK